MANVTLVTPGESTLVEYEGRDTLIVLVEESSVLEIPPVMETFVDLSAGPQGQQGPAGEGIDTYDYNLATLYQIGKL